MKLLSCNKGMEKSDGSYAEKRCEEQLGFMPGRIFSYYRCNICFESGDGEGQKLRCVFEDLEKLLTGCQEKSWCCMRKS